MRLLSIISTFYGQLGRVLLARFYLPFHPFVSCSLTLSEQVRVVQHKRSKKIYALKYIDKSRCLRQKAVANIIQERRLLEEVTNLVVIRHKFPNNIPAGKPPFHCKSSICLSRRRELFLCTGPYAWRGFTLYVKSLTLLTNPLINTHSPFGSQSLYQGGSCEILDSRASLCVGVSSSPAHYSPVIIFLVLCRLNLTIL